MSPTVVFKNDYALHDRFISIEFNSRFGNADPQLLKKLDENSSGTANWALFMPEERFDLFVKATDLNKLTMLDTDDLCGFIRKNCTTFVTL